MTIPNTDARQIVCEEWHRAVKEFGLRPGSSIEQVVGRIIERIDQTPSGWQPIETAPKEGATSILVRFRSGGVAHVYLTAPEPPLAQTFRYFGGPLHGTQAGWPEWWMPLPTPPAEGVTSHD